MKKFLLVLLLLIITTALSFSQGILTANWKVAADAKTYFKNDHLTRGIGYNPATDHLLLPTRTVTHRIIILSAATGDSVGTLDMTGVTGGTFLINLVGATDDGVIYACNLITSGSSPLKIYKWANETAAPKLVYSGNPNTNRWGDALTVVGSGANARVWVSGTGSTAGNNEVAVLKLTNDTLELDKKITLTNYVTVMGIGPVASTGDVWINTANVLGTKVTKFSATGTVLDTVTSSVATDASNSVFYVELGTKKYLLINDGTTQSGRVVDVTNGGPSATYKFTTGILGKNANTNGTGVCVFDTKRKAMVILATNNAIASYNIDSLVNVTITANTATVPDTIGAKSVVQLRGDIPLFGPWSDAGLMMTSAGGDYWKSTVAVKTGNTINYKIFTNGGGKTDLGWENDINPGGNRVLSVPAADVILPLQFVNGTPNKQEQFWTPLTHGTDSVAIMFRINMQGNEGFNKATQFVGVRGAFPASGGDWSKSFVLKQEQSHGNSSQSSYDGTNFWSGVTTVPKSMVGSTIEYKFVTLPTNSSGATVSAWEGTANRSFKVGGDTTLTWVWWENKPPVPFKGADTVDISFRVDLSKAIRQKGFTPGDTVYVNYGWSSTGKDLAGNSPARLTLTKTGITGNVYIATGKAVTKVGSPMYYQYYITKNAQDIRETFFNFDYTGTDASLGERRSVVPAMTTSVVDTITSNTDSRRQPVFPNTQKLSKAIALTLTCDLRPAYYSVKKGVFLNDIQGTVNIGNADSVYLVGVWVNGPMVGGWAGWGGALRDSVKQKMWDDGTHGDATAGDHIYTAQFTLGPTYSDTRANVGQEFKYGIYGGDNESGFGLNHIENIDDASTTYALNTQFGSINPNRYIGWNFDKGQARGDYDLQVSGITATIRGLKVVNANIVWASGNSGTVLRTTNGGTTWESKVIDATYNNYTIDATDANTAWVWGTLSSVSELGLSRLWKTTDGGATWVKQYENTNTYADDIMFFDANNGVAIGDPDDGTNFVIVTTTNGGTSWARIASSKAPAAGGAFGSASSYSVVGSNAWFGTYGSGSIKIYKTTDKGASWNAYSVTGFTDNYSTYMDFKDANTGVAVNTEGKVSLTTDGGVTWGTPVVVDATGLRNVDYIAGSKSIVAVGGATSAGVVYTSANDGKTWVKATIPTVPQLRNVKFASGTTGWIIGNTGTVVKYQGPSLVSVKQIDSKIPTEFSLSQNFPNPFNPETSIRYTLAKDVKVSLRIYDMLGREVKVLVDENQMPGSYEVRFNANQFATGVYFYHLKAGNYSSIKKMMFMK